MNRQANEGELIGEFFGRRQDGFFVEVGANDPRNHSQTWPLEEQGWRGILVEPLSRFVEALRAERPRSQVFAVACGAPGHAPTAKIFVGEDSQHSSLQPHRVDGTTRYTEEEIVRVLTLDEVLAEAGHPHLDFVSIDVEGFQLEVLKGFSLDRYRPALLLVEDHLLDWRTHRYVQTQGYRLVKRTGLNNWYIPAGVTFTMTTPVERLKLWRKVYPGTIARGLKARLRGRR